MVRTLNTSVDFAYFERQGKVVNDQPYSQNSRFTTSRNTIQGVSKKTEQILNRSQRREAAQCMKFLINIDCSGTYDVD